MAAKVDTELCTGCGACVEVCPVEAISLRDGKAQIDGDNRPIHTVIGGMHLLHAGPKRMDKTVNELRRLDVQRLLPCHCTGMEAVARLWQEFPGRCAACPVGTVLEVPA